MISVSNVSMRYGAKVLFEDVATAFTPGKRYGLTGPNGAGKTTFMNLLSGEIEPQKGNVVRPRKLSVLSQDQFAFDAYRVTDTVIMGNKRLWAAMEERDRIYEKPDMSNEDGMRLGELEGIVGEEDGYTAESDAAILLQGLDIPDELHQRRMSELQGGQKVRVLLAQALFGHPQALLLDEPTNHLDLDSIHWLQEFLNHYDGVLITISHDRHFLNSICTHIADIDYETIITYTGGYDDMVMTKTQVRSQIESQNAQREKKIAQLTEFIARFSAGTRSSQVQSRRKEVERLQVNDLARSNIQRPFLKFEMKRPSGKHILELEGVTKSYGEKDVVAGFTASVTRGEKIAIMGRNGAGKTTLLNALLANSPTTPEAELRKTSGYTGAFIDGGKVVWGHEASVGYFPQDHRSLIENGKTVIEWLWQWDPSVHNEDVRGLLGQMLFARDEANKKTEVLSGGEASRLLFCKLMLQQPNVLIFDEPTNHLDLESINALNIALQRYQGTVLLVTHDHDLIDEVATRIWHFDNHQVEDFKGSYDDYQGVHA
ncbi:MAG TPA: ATP-binding cassette domain-containing protein [Candidatus Saccharimonadales bacterium]|jgi:ATPase subunit of ABC transporter with duplicated ATPase domains|nr:ATP-binding cassette domain-containing protein [Candidatus Saccharimonadales bacterium]